MGGAVLQSRLRAQAVEPDSDQKEPIVSTATRAMVVALERVENRTPRRRTMSASDRARIDLLAVDRSVFAKYPLPRWSQEGERGDALVSAYRRGLTEGERVDAWRCLFANVDSNGRPLVRSGYLWWKKTW